MKKEERSYYGGMMKWGDGYQQNLLVEIEGEGEVIGRYIHKLWKIEDSS